MHCNHTIIDKYLGSFYLCRVVADAAILASLRWRSGVDFTQLANDRREIAQVYMLYCDFIDHGGSTA
jgi:hypothetical protein